MTKTSKGDYSDGDYGFLVAICHYLSFKSKNTFVKKKIEQWNLSKEIT